MTKRSVWIGYDPREHSAFSVARRSIRDNVPRGTKIFGLQLDMLKRINYYRRPTEVRDGRLFDVISEAPMSTEFAISRFLVPEMVRLHILKVSGWALFVDCDVLARRSLMPLFKKAEASKDKAVMCVKHKHIPKTDTKMDGQLQLTYARKNWSSVMMFNCDHPANQKLTVELVNTVPGRDLHRFCWLDDDQIGEIGPEWNFLVGHTPEHVDPSIVHFTEGTPAMPGYENCLYANEWRQALERSVVAA